MAPIIPIQIPPHTATAVSTATALIIQIRNLPEIPEVITPTDQAETAHLAQAVSVAVAEVVAEVPVVMDVADNKLNRN